MKLQRKKEKKAVVGYLIIIVILISVNVNANNTMKEVKQQQLNLLNAKYENLKALNSSLSSQPNPESSCDLSLFISTSKINDVLAIVDNFKKPLEGMKDTVFHVNSMRAHFDDGFPEITISAWAEHTESKFKVDLEILALLELKIPQDNLSKANIKVHVKSVVPKASWNFSNLKFQGFIGNLIQLKINSYTQLLPELSFPLKSEISFNFPPQTRTLDFIAGEGRIIGNLSIPGIKVKKTLKVEQVLFLPDGVHAYFTFK